jgi:hypothetical protein
VSEQSEQAVILGKAVFLGCPVCGQPAYSIFVFEFDDESGREESRRKMEDLLCGKTQMQCPCCGAPLLPCGETNCVRLNG